MLKKLFLAFLVFCFILTGNFVLAAWFEPPGPSLEERVTYVFDIVMALVAAIAMIVLAVSAVQLIFSMGNPEKIREAKKMAVSAVVGLAITLSSFLIIQTINPRLKNLAPSEQLKMISSFQFIGGQNGAIIGANSGCGISQCLGTDGSCSGENCGGYDYTGCEEGECAGSDGCSSANCINPHSGCAIGQCLGTDGSCAYGNCNWPKYKPAPLSIENLDEIKREYGYIKWYPTDTDLSGNPINNCDPSNPNLVYNLYLYKDYNFKNLFNVLRIRCDNWWRNLDEAKSYILAKETPGVYFYGNENCYPSGDTPPAAFTESIPEAWSEEVKSIRIVNGHDPVKGPFFGLIYFNGYDYKTNTIPWTMEIQPKIWKPPDFEIYNNYSYCFSIDDSGVKITNGSWVIYKWVGFEEDDKTIAQAGDGITLYTQTEWLGGNKELNGNFSRLSVDLTNTPVSYSPDSDVPPEERAICPRFYPNSSCLKSFEIKGNYLVIVSSGLFRGKNQRHKPDFIGVHAQAFPISPRLKETYKEEIYKKRKADYSVEKGTSELLLDYIGWLKQANFITVIPLAEKLK